MDGILYVYNHSTAFQDLLEIKNIGQGSRKPEKGFPRNISDFDTEIFPPFDDEDNGDAPEIPPPYEEDEPELPQEIPPFKKDDPQVPENIPPFKEDEPLTPEEAPPFKEEEKHMPYKSNVDLPDSVKNALPQHAQDIYREAYNHAWQEYKDPDRRAGSTSREETSHKVAWSAVKNKYVKKGDQWVEK